MCPILKSTFADRAPPMRHGSACEDVNRCYIKPVRAGQLVTTHPTICPQGRGMWRVDKRRADVENPRTVPDRHL